MGSAVPITKKGYVRLVRDPACYEQAARKEAKAGTEKLMEQENR